jgi:hypothetical protein
MNTIVDNLNISPPGQFDDEEMCHANNLKDVCLAVGLAMTGIVLASSIDMFISADFSGDHVWCG